MLAEQDFIQNVAILNQDLRREAWYGTFWHHFVGEVKVINDPSGRPIAVETSETPISRLNGFQGAGRDNMLLPFERDLTGPPVHGDTVAIGTGEEQTFNWNRTYINQTRKVVVAMSGKMSDLRARKLRLIENAKPKLTKWWSKYFNQEIYRSMYEGLSSNLSGSKNYDALGVYKRYHPNAYVNDGAVLTAIGTEKQFTTAAQLDTAAGNADTAMTVAILRKLRVKCLQLKIPQIQTKKGYKFWVMVMHPDQVADLRNDSDYEGAVNSAFNAHRIEHPALNAAEFMIEGFAIYEDIVGIRCWDNAAGGFYGDDDTNPIDSMFEPTVYTDNYCAIVFGNNALGLAVPEKLNFDSEFADFKNVKEVVAKMIWGVSRSDFVTEALAAETSGGMFYKNTTGGVVADTACLNDSSAILMTKRA